MDEIKYTYCSVHGCNGKIAFYGIHDTIDTMRSRGWRVVKTPTDTLFLCPSHASRAEKISDGTVLL